MEKKNDDHPGGKSDDTSSTTGNDLSKLMASVMIRDEISNKNSKSTNSAQQDSDDENPLIKKLDGPSKLVHSFLIKKEPEFVRLTEFRNRGWIENKAEGDAFFRIQRDRADNADYEERRQFYYMMVQISMEMHAATGALNVEGTRPADMKVLDICAAPGGYTEGMLRHNPRVKAFCISLPEELGGHPLIIDKAKLSGLSLIDVTLLLKEFAGDRSVPANHPNKAMFLLTRPFRFHQFDLIFCDGKVLRTHQRETYREIMEVTRLTHSQLILALQRIRPGGTIIMLLHKADLWPSVYILYTFCKFSKVQVFKPAKKHSTRSSFYMIAQDCLPASEEAKAAVQEWKALWWKATFGGVDGLGVREEKDESFVLGVLSGFGDRLLELGRPIWRIQADALSKTHYAGRPITNLEPLGSKEECFDNNKLALSKKENGENQMDGGIL